MAMAMAMADQPSSLPAPASASASASVQAMLASLFREDDDDDDEVRYLQAEIQELAAKARHLSSNGPSLISSGLQTFLHNARPQLSLDRDPADDEHGDSAREGYDPSDDEAMAEAEVLKAKIASLKEGIPVLLQRMKACVQACEKKQRVCEGKKKPPLPGFLQDVHKVWESLSPDR